MLFIGRIGWERIFYFDMSKYILLTDVVIKVV